MAVEHKIDSLFARVEPVFAFLWVPVIYLPLCVCCCRRRQSGRSLVPSSQSRRCTRLTAYQSVSPAWRASVTTRTGRAPPICTSSRYGCMTLECLRQERKWNFCVKETDLERKIRDCFLKHHHQFGGKVKDLNDWIIFFVEFLLLRRRQII